MIVFCLTLYFVVLIVIGFLAQKKVHSLEDYFLAGRSLPMYLAVPSMVATWFGAGSCLGVAATMYNGNIGDIIADPFGCSLALILCSLFFAAPLRRRGYTTINEIIRENYGRGAEILGSVLSLPFYVGTLAAQMLAIGIIMSDLTEISIEMCILLSGGVVVLYTMLGGLWAVTITDGIQLLIFVVCLMIIAWPIVSDVELFAKSLRTFGEELPQLAPKIHPQHGYLSYYGQWLMTGLGAIVGQDIIQRVLACKNDKVARRSTFIAGIFYFLICLLPILLGIYARTLPFFGEQAENVIPYIVHTQHAPWVYPLFVVAILSITMSTADSYLLAGVTVLVHNILPEKHRSMSKVRVASIVMALIAMIVALWVRSIYALMVHSGAFLFVALFVPIVAGVYCNKTYKEACWIGMGVGFTLWGTYLILGRGDFDSLLYAASLVGMIGCMIGFVITHCVMAWSERIVRDARVS